jgi:uroporphyrinogen-III synthase
MKRLIILRPEPGASETCSRARALGLDPLSIPLFRVHGLDWEAPDAAGFDGLLLTSANAVRHGGEQLQQLRGLKAYCVGQATADAARDAGFDIAATGKAGVERLLGSIESDRKLLHLAGEDRIEIKGAPQPITALVVYRAEELKAPAELDQAQGGVTLIHSPRAGRRFAEIVEERRLDRSAIAVAAISEAAADAAGTGWAELGTAESPDDPSLLALARRMCDKPGR